MGLQLRPHLVKPPTPGERRRTSLPRLEPLDRARNGRRWPHPKLTGELAWEINAVQHGDPVHTVVGPCPDRALDPMRGFESIPRDIFKIEAKGYQEFGGSMAQHARPGFPQQ